MYFTCFLNDHCFLNAQDLPSYPCGFSHSVCQPNENSASSHYQTPGLRLGQQRDMWQIYLAWAWLSYGRLKFHLAQPLVAQNPQNLEDYTRAVVSITFLRISSSVQQAVGVRFSEQHTAPACLQGNYFLPLNKLVYFLGNPEPLCNATVCNTTVWLFKYGDHKEHAGCACCWALCQTSQRLQ